MAPGPGSSRNDRVRRRYDAQAAKYDRCIAKSERLLVGDGRRWVCSQATGDVLEIGAGTGRNLPFYPAGVRITGIDLSPAMIEVARQRAAELNIDADLRVGDAHALAFPESSFDSVVCTLSLCTIPDWRRAVAEAARVLRPGGRLLLLEHVRSPWLPVRAVQWVLEPFFVWTGDDYLLREPLGAVREQGLQVERLERSKLGLVERLVARKPD